jgi:DNA-binding transcriptional MerR regulator
MTARMSPSSSERTHLSIREVLEVLVEEFPDVTISKIRFLESRGLIHPERTPAGYRRFYRSDIERLRFILQEQREEGRSLKVIKGRLERQTPYEPSLFELSADEPFADLPAFERSLATVPAERRPASAAPPLGGEAMAEAAAIVPARAAAVAGVAAAGSNGRSNGLGYSELAGTGPAAAGSLARAVAAEARPGEMGAARRPSDASRRRGDEPPGPGSSGRAASGGHAGENERPGAGTGRPAHAAGRSNDPPARRPEAGGPPAEHTAEPATAEQAAPPGVPTPAGASGQPGAGPNAEDIEAAVAPQLAPGAHTAGRAAPARRGGGERGEGAAERSTRSGAASGRHGRPSTSDEDAAVATAAVRPDRATGAEAAEPAGGGGGGAEAAARIGAPSSLLRGIHHVVTGASFSSEELAVAAGVAPAVVEELVECGLIAGRDVAGIRVYDEDALLVARVAGAFRRFGIEGRHLKSLKHAAEREAGLFAQVVTPLLRQRNPQSHERAVTDLQEMSELGAALRAHFLQAELRQLTGG